MWQLLVLLDKQSVRQVKRILLNYIVEIKAAWIFKNEEGKGTPPPSHPIFSWIAQRYFDLILLGGTGGSSVDAGKRLKS